VARLGGLHGDRVRPFRIGHLPGVLPVRGAQVPAPAFGSQGSPEGERATGGGAAQEERGSTIRRMLLGNPSGGAQGADLLAAPVRLVSHLPVPTEPPHRMSGKRKKSGTTAIIGAKNSNIHF